MEAKPTESLTFKKHFKSLKRQGKVTIKDGGDDNLSSIWLIKLTDLLDPKNIKEEELGL